MAQILTSITQVTGNYESSFSYTLNASFNGIEGDIDSARIRFFVPNIIDISFDSFGDFVKEVTEEAVLDGRIVTLDLGAIEDLGVSIRLGFSASFTLDAMPESTYSFTPTLWINGSEYQTYESEPITLSVIPNFILTHELVLPSTFPTPSGNVYYKVTLQNVGDLFARVENLAISISPNENLLLDDSYPIVGKDISRSYYADTGHDGIVGVVSDNIISFMLDSYRGERYSFLYRGTLDERASIGDQITTNTSFSIDSVSQETVSYETEIGNPQSDATISLYGPLYTLPSSNINHAFSIRNTGNQNLEDAAISGVLSDDIKYTSLKTGIFHIDVIDEKLGTTYEIFYTTTNGNTGSLGSFNSDSSSRINLSNFIAEDDNLLSLSIPFGNLGIGAKTKSSFQLDGIVKEAVPLETIIQQIFNLTWKDATESNQATATKNTEVSDQSALIPIGVVSPTDKIVKIGDTITYTIGVNANNSRLENPVIAMLLPNELRYTGNARIDFRQYFNAITPTLPEPTIIPDYNEAKDTLVLFSFTEASAYTLEQKANLRIAFDTTVAVGALGSFASSVFLDTKELDFTQYYSFEKEVLFLAGVKSDKKIMGSLDSIFVEEPDVASTQAGKSLVYLITIENIGNAVFDNIEIVDLLPFVGDTSVLNTSIARKSAFRIYTLTDIIVRKKGSDEAITSTISYSKSSDPIRFGPSFNMIGTGSWLAETPSDASSIYAIKLQTKNMLLAPGEALQIGISAIAPSDAPVSQIAWNSFAANISYLDNSGESIQLLAVEPEKVGVIIKDIPEPPKEVNDIKTILKVNQSATNMVKNIIRNEMLLEMKLADTMEINI
ncbi:MAG: hypothetical protein R3Y47_08915 [Lachnospiraceae bacterium]